jgi:AcrR family transcriptional regulator
MTARNASDSGNDTRTEILRVALAEFGKRGYYSTSLRVIAAKVGISKAAVLYHFPEKADLLAALAAPVLDDMEHAVRAAANRPAGEARWVVIEGLLGVWLKHRRLLRLSLRDLALSAAQPVFARFREAMFLANAIVAGRRPSLAARVRAAQAIAMLGDPVVLLDDVAEDELRAEVLRGVRALFHEGTPGASGAHESPRGPRRKRGRPSAMAPAMRQRALKMANAGRSVDEIAAALGVSRATVYRHIRGDI